MARLIKNKRRQGVVLIEAALVLPILIGTALLMLQFGWMFLRAEQVANAARQAARRAVLMDATVAEVNQDVSALMNQAGMTTYNPPIISPGIDVAKGELVTVTVSVPVPGNNAIDLLGISGWAHWGVLMPQELKTSVSMAKE